MSIMDFLCIDHDVRNSGVCARASDGFVDCNKDRTVPKDRAFPDGLPRYVCGKGEGTGMLLGEGREGQGRESGARFWHRDRQHV